MPYRSALLALLLSFLFYACTKDGSNPSSYRLKTIISGNDSIGYRHIVYSSQGKAVAFIDSGNNGHVWNTTVEYNSQGNPVKIKKIFLNINYSPPVDSLQYNNKQQVIKKISGPFLDGTYKTSHSFAYDEKGRLIADTIYTYWNLENLYGYVKFSYDGNDNIEKIQRFINVNGVMNAEAATTLTYDNKVSPLKDFGWLLYFTDGEYSVPVKNNILTKTYHHALNSSYDTMETYSYEFENSRVKKMVLHSKRSNGDFSSPTEFFYE